MKKKNDQKWMIIVLTLIFFNGWSAASETKLLLQPDIYQDKIVFCHGGNLYTSTIEGKRVEQLTSFPGEECLPKFSPDGKQIAFTAEFEGNVDVYVMPIEGGEPKRLTYHQLKDWVVDWHPNGKKILFRSARSSFSHRFNRLHTISATGGLPEVLDLKEAELASYNHSGDKIAFCRTSLELTPPWKKYRGGMAPNIWTYDLKDRKSEPVILSQSIDQYPMWINDSIYFLSDRGENKQQNLWVYDQEKKETRQITFHKDWGIEYASQGDNQIVYECGGSLYLYNIKKGKTHAIKIHITLPKNHLASETINVNDKLDSMTISPDGNQAIIAAGGDLFLIDPAKKQTGNLTDTSNINEKSPIWSPDGKYFAYISDASGEEQIYVREINGKKKSVATITNCIKTRFGSISWSPDSKKIGYSDHRSTYYIIDVETKRTQKVFFNSHQATYLFVDASWSPDSQWLAFSNWNQNYMGSIYLFSLQSGKTHRITGDFTHDEYPQFDPEGRYLFWVTGHEVNVESSYWDNNHHMINPSKIIVATLQKDTFEPFSIEQDSNGEKNRNTPSQLQIDIEGLGKRVTSLAVKDSIINNLTAIKGKLIYISDSSGGETALKMFDIAEKKESNLLENTRVCIPAANANKIIYRSGNTVGLVDINPNQKVGDGKIDLSDLKVTIEYRSYWKHLLDEAWRIQRDNFWDENLNGTDWLAVKKRYDSLVPYVASRKDLSHLIDRMFAELGHSHVELSSRDSLKIPQENNGLLGIDLEWDTHNQRYRITKIYRGQNWNHHRISPLTLPGMNIKAGDFLLAIDGTLLEKSVNPYAYLVNKAGKTITITVHSKPSIEGSRVIKVKPVTIDRYGCNFPRYNDWVLSNMEKVNKASGGKIGYIHIPDTYYNGIESFFRYFHPQLDKLALIVDVRFNSGGFSPYWMLEQLNRKLIHVRHLPHGKAPMLEAEPGFFGLKVCITNEWVESGGEVFADTFRQLNSGPIIGKRTSGSLSSTGGFRLMDRSVVTFPVLGPPMNQGKVFIENMGVSPDIEVTNLPDDMIRGKDAQLERGIKELMKKLDASK